MASVNRAVGALLGLASRDALGTAVEPERPGSFEPVTRYGGSMRRLILTLVLAAAALVSAPGVAGAAETYCSSTGDICVGANRVDGVRLLRISTFGRYFSQVSICVDPPRGANKCVQQTIKRKDTFYGTSVVWARAFPNHGRGTYFVRFYIRHGSRVGKLISFRV